MAKRKMRWRDAFFPPSPMKIAERDRKAIEAGIELTDPEEFRAIKRRQDTLERRVNELEAWKEVMLTKEKDEIDATRTDEQTQLDNTFRDSPDSSVGDVPPSAT
jgi:hypothetical protein